MYAIKITNDEPDECELWGPYDTEDVAQQVVAAYAEVPSSSQIIRTTKGVKLSFTGCPL